MPGYQSVNDENGADNQQDQNDFLWWGCAGAVTGVCDVRGTVEISQYDDLHDGAAHHGGDLLIGDHGISILNQTRGPVSWMWMVPVMVSSKMIDLSSIWSGW
jgi:hypothetical protein